MDCGNSGGGRKDRMLGVEWGRGSVIRVGWYRKQRDVRYCHEALVLLTYVVVVEAAATAAASAATAAVAAVAVGGRAWRFKLEK